MRTIIYLPHVNYLTFKAKMTVFNIISVNITYSNAWEVTSHHILYCHLALGIYLLIGLAFNANSIHFLCKNNDKQYKNTWLLMQILYTFSLKIILNNSITQASMYLSGGTTETEIRSYTDLNKHYFVIFTSIK